MRTQTKENLQMPRRIAYLCWPTTEITGGIKLVFKHVELLCGANVKAVVVTDGATYPTWYESSAEVVGHSDVRKDDDILVFPENHAELLARYADWPNPKVIYCQNHFMIWRGLAGRDDYRALGIQGILTLGRQGADFCHQRFPGLPVFSVPVGVDRDVFHFQSDKILRIAFAPRKRPMEASFIHDWFRAVYPQWRSVPWIAIDNMSENVVAQALKESAIYLSLQRFESVGMSALEAMACGCAVAGFTGQGGREYATSSNGFWAEEDDCFECASQLACAVGCMTQGGQRVQDLLEAANRTASAYAMTTLSARVVGFWRRFLDKGRWPTP